MFGFLALAVAKALTGGLVANVFLTSACNRSCPYCFVTGSRRPGPTTNMSRSTFDSVVAFLKRSQVDEVRLFGGEPTLHPEFPWLLQRALTCGMRVTVFTNGMAPEVSLSALARAPHDRLRVLVNINAPSEQTPAETEQQEAALRRLRSSAMLGFNIYRPDFSPDFLLERIEAFGLSRVIRFGLAHPSVGKDNLRLHPRHYEAVGRRLTAFAMRAQRAGVHIAFDCGFVPCMFEGDDALSLLGKAAEDLGQRCNPLPDILTEGEFIPCYPLADTARISLAESVSIDTVTAALSERIAHFRLLGIHRNCGECQWKTVGRCSGGCIATALTRIRRESFGVEVPRAGPSRLHSLPVQATTVSCKRPDAGAGMWTIPYVDQSVQFWRGLYEEFGGQVRQVYFPLPSGLVGSGRPTQPSRHLEAFLREAPFAHSALINPVTLPRPTAEIAPHILDAIRRLRSEVGLDEVTVSDLDLARHVRESFPDLRITASVLMDIASPFQALALDNVCDTLVPASRIVRNLNALGALRAAYRGRIRLLVNESCLPGCPFRKQHFYEMANGCPVPRPQCNVLLKRLPWARLAGAWILPQHLHLYAGIYDELKLAGRATLTDADQYRRVLRSYVHALPLAPHEIGGGPASVLSHIEVSETFFAATLRCGMACHECSVCPDYYREHGPRS